MIFGVAFIEDSSGLFEGGGRERRCVSRHLLVVLPCLRSGAVRQAVGSSNQPPKYLPFLLFDLRRKRVGNKNSVQVACAEFPNWPLHSCIPIIYICRASLSHLVMHSLRAVYD